MTLNFVLCRCIYPVKVLIDCFEYVFFCYTGVGRYVKREAIFLSIFTPFVSICFVVKNLTKQN